MDRNELEAIYLNSYFHAILSSDLINNIAIHPKCSDDLQQLIQHSDSQGEYIKKIRYKLQVLSDHGIDIIKQKDFEKLKGKDSSDLFSCKIKTATQNSRILFIFKDDMRVLILAFEEISGKRKTEYRNFIPEANRRKKELLNNW